MARPSFAALLRHLVIESLAREISRQSHRRLVRTMERLRPGSFPFVSADTFRSLADTVVERGGVKRRQKLTRRSIIFFDLAELSKGEKFDKNRAQFRLLGALFGELVERPVVILHNGDLLPQDDVMDWLIGSCHHVFSVNITEDRAGLTAIPVGIENVYRHSNGKLEDFIAFRDGTRSEVRTELIFSSFNVANNRQIRGPLAEALTTSPFHFDSRRISSAEHRSRTMRAKFVLSPPGNGIDCHRTWEAIYLGAVPVVLTGYISPDLIRGLPILAVNSFEDFLSRPQSDLSEEFDRIREVGVEKAFMPFWVSEVFRKSNDL